MASWVASVERRLGIYDFGQFTPLAGPFMPGYLYGLLSGRRRWPAPAGGSRPGPR